MNTIKDILDLLVPLVYLTGIITFFIAIFLLSRRKQNKMGNDLIERSKKSLSNSDKVLEENLTLRKQQVANQEKIIGLLEEINKKLNS